MYNTANQQDRYDNAKPHIQTYRQYSDFESGLLFAFGIGWINSQTRNN